MTNFTDAELNDRITRQQRQRECRYAYQQFLADQRPHAFVTLTINRGPRRLETMKENLAKWAYYCDGRFVQPQNYVPTSDRVSGTGGLMPRA